MLFFPQEKLNLAEIKPFSHLFNSKFLKYLKKIIGNKYLLTGVAFGIWMVFFDRNNIPQQIGQIRELNQLEESEQAMSQKIMETRKELDNLKNSPEMLEKYARENYLMKKPNEDLFLVESIKKK